MSDLHGEERSNDSGFDMFRERENMDETDWEKELNFKTAMKGFNKKEVADYIAELNRGFQTAQASLTERLSHLTDEVAVLKHEREENVKIIDELKSHLSGGGDESYFVDRYQGDIDALKHDKAYLKKQNAEISEKYRELVKEMDELKQGTERTISERDKLVKECAELRAQSILASSQVKELSEQNLALRKETGTRGFGEDSKMSAVDSAKVDEIKAQRDSLDEKARNLEAELVALKDKLQSAIQEVNQAKGEKSALERKLDAAKEGKEVGIRSLKQELTAMTKQKDEADKKLEELKASFDSKMTARNLTVEELKKNCASLEEKLELVQRSKEIQTNTKNREIMELKKENAELKGKLESGAPVEASSVERYTDTKQGFFGRFAGGAKGRMVDPAVFEEEISSLKQANSELTTQLTNTKRSKETEYNTLNKLINNLKQENAELSSELEETKASVNANIVAEEQAKRLSEERDALQKKNEDYRKKIEHLQGKIGEAITAVKAAGEAGAVGEEQVKRLTAEKDALQKQNDNYRAEIEQLEKRVIEATNAVSDADVAGVAGAEKLKLMAGERDVLQKQNVEYRAEIEQLQKKVAEAANAVSALDTVGEEQMKHLTKERNDLLMANTDYRNKIQQLENKLELMAVEIGKQKSAAVSTIGAELLDKNKLLADKLEQLQNKNDELLENINQKKAEIYELKRIINGEADSEEDDVPVLDDEVDTTQYVDDLDRRMRKL